AAFKIVGKGQFLVAHPSLIKPINAACGSNLGGDLCTVVLFLLASVDSNQTNKTRLSVYFSHYPAGTSVNNILHSMQRVRCNCFQKFDYGIIKNLAKYGKTKPPEYKLSRVEVPVAIYWSKGDWYAAEKDVARLQEELPNVVEYYQ
ncbi:hypothetical protein HPB47_002975, partial [Ixodes persulcatus]